MTGVSLISNLKIKGNCPSVALLPKNGQIQDEPQKTTVTRNRTFFGDGSDEIVVALDVVVLCPIYGNCDSKTKKNDFRPQQLKFWVKIGSLILGFQKFCFLPQN